MWSGDLVKMWSDGADDGRLVAEVHSVNCWWLMMNLKLLMIDDVDAESYLVIDGYLIHSTGGLMMVG